MHTVVHNQCTVRREEAAEGENVIKYIQKYW